MEIYIVKAPITTQKLKKIAEEGFGDMVKAVVDIEKKIMTLGGELHADGEALLLEQGSLQENLWGINFYPEKPREEMIEFTSLINVRPSQGNRSLEIKDERMRRVIVHIADTLIET